MGTRYHAGAENGTGHPTSAWRRGVATKSSLQRDGPLWVRRGQRVLQRHVGHVELVIDHHHVKKAWLVQVGHFCRGVGGANLDLLLGLGAPGK
jgi:hypothetical protein